MNKKLITQTLNEWRANLWLAVEFLIVSVIVWYAVDFCYVKWMCYSQPLGFEIDHTYKVQVKTIGMTSPDYVARESNDADKLELIDRLRRREDIECAAWSNTAHPYNNSFTLNQFRVDTLLSSAYSKKAEPDFFNVFRCRGANGESSEQLAQALRDRGAVITSNMFDNVINAGTLVGDSIYTFNERAISVGAVIDPIRISEYDRMENGNKTVIERGKIKDMDELCVRVKSNMDHDFINRFMADAGKHYKVGNLYVASVTSFDTLRNIFNNKEDREITSMVTAILFLLVNIFLGLFGTFWFRTQQRVSEIAIRKVNGASYHDIFRRFIGEGIVILSVITPVALGFDYLITHYELNELYKDSFFSWGRFLICAAITYLLLAVMIVLGIMVPALRAMRLQPAIALHDE